jgi:hypothetical protein
LRYPATRIAARSSSARRTTSARRTCALRLAEPIRTRSLDLLVGYTRSAICRSNEVPGSARAGDGRAREERIERRLWSLAREALDMAPTASAPRLYAETLNEMIDGENARVAAFSKGQLQARSPSRPSGTQGM